MRIDILLKNITSIGFMVVGIMVFINALLFSYPDDMILIIIGLLSFILGELIQVNINLEKKR